MAREGLAWPNSGIPNKPQMWAHALVGPPGPEGRRPSPPATLPPPLAKCRSTASPQTTLSSYALFIPPHLVLPPRLTGASLASHRPGLRPALPTRGPLLQTVRLGLDGHWARGHGRGHVRLRSVLPLLPSVPCSCPCGRLTISRWGSVRSSVARWVADWAFPQRMKVRDWKVQRTAIAFLGGVGFFFWRYQQVSRALSAPSALPSFAHLLTLPQSLTNKHPNDVALSHASPSLRTRASRSVLGRKGERARGRKGLQRDARSDPPEPALVRPH